MLFTRPFKERIAAGEITLTYRVWRQPRAKAGGRYNIPPYGAIEVASVTQTRLDAVTAADARDAGFATVEELARQLKAASDAAVYRVAFEFLGSKPVKQPDKGLLADEELADLAARLRKTDRKIEGLALLDVTSRISETLLQRGDRTLAEADVVLL